MKNFAFSKIKSVGQFWTFNTCLERELVALSQEKYIVVDIRRLLSGS